MIIAGTPNVRLNCFKGVTPTISVGKTRFAQNATQVGCADEPSITKVSGLREADGVSDINIELGRAVLTTSTHNSCPYGERFIAGVELVMSSPGFRSIEMRIWDSCFSLTLILPMAGAIVRGQVCFLVQRGPVRAASTYRLYRRCWSDGASQYPR